MPPRRVGIRELKSRLSECVKEVKLGATIIVTEHGRRVARLVPETHSLDERLAALKDSGAILWSGRSLGRPTPVARAVKTRSVADLLIENRG